MIFIDFIQYTSRDVGPFLWNDDSWHTVTQDIF